MRSQPRKSTFMVSDPAYDVIAMIHEKSKALKAYDQYLSDVLSDTSLRQLIVNIRHDEQRHIDQLKNHLARLLLPEQ